MSLQDLPYDIFLNLLGLLDSRSLLPLACTSRALEDAIIPEFLYKHVYVSSTSGRLQYFLHCITAEDGPPADLVRSLDVGIIPARLEPLFADALARMRNLRDFHLTGMAYAHSPPESAKVFGSLSALRHLHLGYCELHKLREGLSQLQTLHVSGNHVDWSPMISSHGVGMILLNSRETLIEISVRNGINWIMGENPSSRDIGAGPRGDFRHVWPLVHTLDLSESTLTDEDSPVDLSLSFPSVRSFGAPRNHWAEHPHTRLFVSRLESFQGSWADMKNIVSSFSNLRRAVIQRGSVWGTTFIFTEYLPSTLESLEMSFAGGFLSHLDTLVEATPNLVFLSIELMRQTLDELFDTAAFLVTCVSRLPLAYLTFRCRTVDLRTGSIYTLDQVEAEWESAYSALKLQPGLQAVCLKVGKLQRYRWRKSAARSPFGLRFAGGAVEPEDTHKDIASGQVWSRTPLIPRQQVMYNWLQSRAED
ncbi:hypothetical protein BOTBODRAFT_191389 [Botryobasidium botryosum FD-172 SS1]|uniref:F-box domain-containing protein n=1 Tax=Botryobasidium botryosum (strain FD-172 SS1) TaxID=930990 RepID=A0A067MAP2_BOTB1|nr:hypothetical protein BOTBODRAFT_191389 [Botryobasidium botryosum FD-172 SS1]